MRKMVLLLMVALAIVVAAPAFAEPPPRTCPQATASADEQPILVRLFLATAEEAEAECIDDMQFKSCECIDACEDDCINEWWNCGWPNGPETRVQCDRLLNRCIEECSCGTSCWCDMGPDCTC